MNRRTAIAAIVATFLQAIASAAPRPRFRIGILSISFARVDVHDAKAAIDVWLTKICDRIGLDYSSELFDSHETALSALREKRVDAVYVTPFEYYDLAERVELVPLLVSATGSSQLENYVMLARTDAIHGEGLKPFAGKRAVVHTASRGRALLEWMQTELCSAGLPEAKAFFSQVEEIRKPESAILSVYFGQSDLCLVGKNAFQMACELNPQIAKKVGVVMQSPPMIPGMLVKRKDYVEGKDKEVVATASRLHESADGRQVLTLIKIERMGPYSPDLMQGAEELYRLRKAQKAKGTAP